MNYTELKSIAVSLSDNDETEVSGYLDTAIDIVESRLNNTIRVRQMATRWMVNTDQEYITLPPDWLESQRVSTTASNEDYPLEYYTPYELKRLPDTNGAPAAYTVVGNLLQLYPVPDQEYDILVSYWKRITPLDDTNTTNWVSTDYPQIYINGVMVEVHKFLFDEQRAAYYEDMFVKSINELQKNDTKASTSGAPLQMRLA